MIQHYLVLGKNGQLGRCLTRALAARKGCALSGAFGREELDVADRDAVMGIEGDVSWLLNAAAYTAVDRCEAETAACHAVNAEGPGYLADWCRDQAAGLVHVSTDYVFAGDATSPYRETDPTVPRTAYGRSKLAGETRVRERLPSAWIVRTSWVFGPGRNFVGAIVRQGVLREAGKAEGPLRVVDDQLGCPTSAADLAEAILALTQIDAAGRGGLLHLSNAEPCSWWDFARAILDGTGYGGLEIDRVATREFPTPAPRPTYSVLDGAKAAGLGIVMRSWREALEDYLAGEDFQQLHRALREEVVAAS
ncbi:MAG: dTDP-4-dehydrorhamnose reductase [bacterium]|nr:dTDP-4-dehydrorhamnose reductase [bacterium]